MRVAAIVTFISSGCYSSNLVIEMKTLVEWKEKAQDGKDLWRQVRVEVNCSRLNNLYFKHDGTVFVLPDMKTGTTVLKLEGKKWVQAGRVARGCVFLGSGLTFAEFNEQQFKNETVLPKVVFA